MVVLIVLNIILIISLIILVIYLLKNKKDSVKSICVNDGRLEIKKDDNKHVNKHKNKIQSERVFVGRFVTDEEYQQMMKNRRSDISILLDELNIEYAHLKEISK